MRYDLPQVLRGIVNDESPASQAVNDRLQPRYKIVLIEELNAAALDVQDSASERFFQTDLAEGGVGQPIEPLFFDRVICAPVLVNPLVGARGRVVADYLDDAARRTS